MAIIRRFILYITLIALLLVAATFAYNNSAVVSIDLWITQFEDVPISIAFVLIFSLGWIFGLFTVGVALIRTASDRRKLRRKLRAVELEIDNIRRRPLQDAD
ncbi:lipopolysaccharide assembly protein LapA domain-containing protein [Gammaproteobacteria bacterium]|nr:lipopolysaccharide assembly protein LapA domain-containing protein [Gammaproteobacteria bacterium]